MPNPPTPSVPKDLVVIADAHLGYTPGDIEGFIHWVQELEPARFRLLFLGDFFHIWAGPKKYHTEPVQAVLKVLEHFRAQGGQVDLVVGNRDVFFKETRNAESEHLPFQNIYLERTELVDWAGLVVEHGDLVNTEDKRYLTWRKILRSSLFRAFFACWPPSKVKKVMFSLEAGMKGSNQAFKIDFPKALWEQHVGMVQREQRAKLLLVGHFHPERLVCTTHGDFTALVVPDWATKPQYLRIKPDFTYEMVEL